MIPFIYARVSTQQQDYQMQLDECREFCRRRDWSFPRVFCDKESGGKESRLELDFMMAEIRRGRCDVLVVYRFDRFSRSLKQLVNALEEFRALNVDFVSLHDNVDTSTPGGRLHFHMVAAFAQFNREMIAENVRSGLAKGQAQRGPPGTAYDSERRHDPAGVCNAVWISTPLLAADRRWSGDFPRDGATRVSGGVGARFVESGRAAMKPCKRCDGKGTKVWSRIHNHDRCFRCAGTGVDRRYVVKQPVTDRPAYQTSREILIFHALMSEAKTLAQRCSVLDRFFRFLHPSGCQCGGCQWRQKRGIVS